jgi:hypothetical protein
MSIGGARRSVPPATLSTPPRVIRLKSLAIAARWVPSGDMPRMGGTPPKTKNENESQRPQPSAKFFSWQMKDRFTKRRSNFGSLVLFAAGPPRPRPLVSLAVRAGTGSHIASGWRLAQ